MEDIRAVLKLGEEPAEYEFSIERRQDPPILHIPGDHRGPDVCIPEKQEQMKWLDSLEELMTPFWDCQWKFKSKATCETFITTLKSMEIEKDI